MRLLGIDFGEKYIGLALSDPLQSIARPFKTIPSNQESLEEIKKICQDEEVEKIILGLPKSMDGSLGPQGEKTLQFKKDLESKLDLPVELEDERLTTKLAANILSNNDPAMRRDPATRGKKKIRESREELNKLAAQLILESHLNRM
ncbi:Holliday junction resolvase RuvX [Patescibacteria group bacterium]